MCILKKSISYTIFVIGLAVLSYSCKKDNSVSPKEDSNLKDYISLDSTGYLVGLRTQENIHSPFNNYILSTHSLMTGSISTTGNRGIKLVGGANFYSKVGSTYYSIDYNHECIGYSITDGKFAQKGKTNLDRIEDFITSAPDNKTLIVIGAGIPDCRIQLVNSDDISVSKNVKHPIYVSYDSSGRQISIWPTDAYVDGDKLFVSFFTYIEESSKMPNADTAFISIFSYPALEQLKTLKDARTGPIGNWGGSPAIMKDESGDHYTVSNSSLNAGYTKTTKNSAILKIRAGEDKFDSTYFFDVEAVSGYELLTSVYVGNGIAVGRAVIEEDTAKSNWYIFSGGPQTCKMVVLDLINKTVKDVDGIPAHIGQEQTPFLVENGKVYVSINAGSDIASVKTGTEAYIYEIDPATATGTKGAKIEGRGIQAFFKY